MLESPFHRMVLRHPISPTIKKKAYLACGAGGLFFIDNIDLAQLGSLVDLREEFW